MIKKYKKEHDKKEEHDKKDEHHKKDIIKRMIFKNQ